MPKFKNHDEYIAKAAPFAQPILKQIRAAFHKAHPDIEETMKWSMPHFEYNGILANMAGFKEHCSFGFWKGTLMKTIKGFEQVRDTAMSYGKFTTVGDLPPDKTLIKMIREAVELNEKGVKVKRDPPKPKGKLVVPDYLTKALNKNKAAKKTFEDFSPSNQREYVNWLTDAKTEATRESRLKQAIEWMAEGKPRMWKYMKKW
jgi:uncharacterized protein YdeI (YjbR/CyaY-like superfamily)